MTDNAKTAWLIEREGKGGTGYVSEDGGWTNDPNKAMRYASEQIALCVKETYSLKSAMVAEYSWPDGWE